MARIIKDLKSPERTGTEEAAGDKTDSKVCDNAVDSKPAAVHIPPEGEKTGERRIRGEGKPRTSTSANVHVIMASESKSLQGVLPMRQQTGPDFVPAAESSRESNPNSHPSRSNTVTDHEWQCFRTYILTKFIMTSLSRITYISHVSNESYM